MHRFVFLACLLICPAQAVASDLDGHDEEVQDNSDEPSPIGAVLMYLPNRIFDLFDIVRLRAKVGPGFGLGMRITEPVSVYLGSHASVYAGLPGPRQEPEIPIPVGVETHSGLTLSVWDATFDAGGVGPEYSPTEIGVNAHLLLVGADVTVDPVEIVDFLFGVFGVDISGDDL
jgi:hypothetical protein